MNTTFFIRGLVSNLKACRGALDAIDSEEDNPPSICHSLGASKFMVGSHENVPLGTVKNISNIDFHACLKAHFEQLLGSGTNLAWPLWDFNVLNK